jgi:uncharacterized membrane protein
LVTVGSAVKAAIAVILVLILGSIAMKLLNHRKTLTQVGMGIILALFGSILAKVHLRYFDKQYLEMGRIRSNVE